MDFPDNSNYFVNNEHSASRTLQLFIAGNAFFLVCPADAFH